MFLRLRGIMNLPPTHLASQLGCLVDNYVNTVKF